MHAARSAHPAPSAPAAGPLGLLVAVAHDHGRAARRRLARRGPHRQPVEAVLFVHGYNPTSNSTDCGGTSTP